MQMTRFYSTSEYEVDHYPDHLRDYEGGAPATEISEAKQENCSWPSLKSPWN